MNEWYPRNVGAAFWPKLANQRPRGGALFSAAEARVYRWRGALSMADYSLHQETVDFSLSTLGTPDRSLVGLSLSFHPDVLRVGQVTPLFSLAIGGSRRLSRLEPDFFWHGADQGSPLTSPVLSRTPIVIRATDHGSVAIENEAALASVQVNVRGSARAVR